MPPQLKIYNYIHHNSIYNNFLVKNYFMQKNFLICFDTLYKYDIYIYIYNFKISHETSQENYFVTVS